MIHQEALKASTAQKQDLPKNNMLRRKNLYFILATTHGKQDVPVKRSDNKILHGSITSAKTYHYRDDNRQNWRTTKLPCIHKP